MYEGAYTLLITHRGQLTCSSERFGVVRMAPI